jgi:ferredoxin
MAKSSSYKSGKEKRLRKKLLSSLGVKDFFVEGSIVISGKTCQGIECKLCIKACPTNALYWKPGKIGITEELCIYCGACVLSCIVDNCIRITRKRSASHSESFSNPKDFMKLQHCINANKRIEKIREAFPKSGHMKHRKSNIQIPKIYRGKEKVS